MNSMRFVALGFAFLVAGTGLAQADAIRVRGTVVGFDGALLTVKTRDGNLDAIKLAAGWKVSGVATASIKDIKQGDFLGIGVKSGRRQRRPRSGGLSRGFEGHRRG